MEVKRKRIMKTFESILDLIGKTPLIRLRTGFPEDGPKVYIKLEYFNPSGSIKDRMTYYILNKAMKAGTLKKGDTVIDNTSGNTGSSLAMVASVFGLHVHITFCVCDGVRSGDAGLAHCLRLCLMQTM